ncbi:MAG: hypothetical protein U0625_13005 [Phycisphaerales bacterium]
MIPRLRPLLRWCALAVAIAAACVPAQRAQAQSYDAIAQILAFDGFPVELTTPLELSELQELLETARTQPPPQAVIAAYEQYLDGWVRARQAMEAERAQMMRRMPPPGQLSTRYFELDADAQQLFARAGAERTRLEDALFAAIAAAGRDDAARAGVATARQLRRAACLRETLQNLLPDAPTLAFADIEQLVTRVAHADPAAAARAHAALAPLFDERVQCMRRLADDVVAARRAACAAAKKRGITVLDVIEAAEGEFMLVETMNGPTTPDHGAAGAPGAEAPASTTPSGGASAAGANAAPFAAIAAIAEIDRIRTKGLGTLTLELLQRQVRACRVAADALGGELGTAFWLRVLGESPYTLCDPELGGGAGSFVEHLMRRKLDPARRDCLRAAWARWHAEWTARAVQALDATVAKMRTSAREGVAWIDDDLRISADALEQESTQSAKRAVEGCGARWRNADSEDELTPEEMEAMLEVPEPSVLDGLPGVSTLREAFRRQKQSEEEAADPDLAFAMDSRERSRTAIAPPPVALDALRAQLVELGSDDAVLASLESLHGAYAARWSEEVAPLETAVADARYDSSVPEADAASRRAALAAAARAVDGSLFAALRAVAGESREAQEAIAAIELARSLGDARVEGDPFYPGCDEANGGLRVNPVDVVLSAEIEPAARKAALAALAPLVPGLRERLAAYHESGERASREHAVAMARVELEEAVTADGDAALRRRMDAMREAIAAADAYCADASRAIDQACAAAGPQAEAALRRVALRRRFPSFFVDEAMAMQVAQDLAERASADADAVLRIAAALDHWRGVAATARERLIAVCGQRMEPFDPVAMSASAEISAAREQAMQAQAREECCQRALRQVAVELLRNAVPAPAAAGSRKFAAMAARAGLVPEP